MPDIHIFLLPHQYSWISSIYFRHNASQRSKILSTIKTSNSMTKSAPKCTKWRHKSSANCNALARTAVMICPSVTTACRGATYIAAFWARRQARGGGCGVARNWGQILKPDISETGSHNPIMIILKSVRNCRGNRIVRVSKRYEAV